MTNWQPIRTAPKNGTEILAYREDAGVFIARYASASEFLTEQEVEEQGWTDEDLFSEDWFCADFVSGCRLDGSLAPTHWMPLLDTPESEAAPDA